MADIQVNYRFKSEIENRRVLVKSYCTVKDLKILLEKKFVLSEGKEKRQILFENYDFNLYDAKDIKVSLD